MGGCNAGYAPSRVYYSRVRLAAEATASQPVNILESAKHAHQLRGCGQTFDAVRIYVSMCFLSWLAVRNFYPLNVLMVLYRFI